MSRTMKRVACSKCRRPNDPWRSFCGACGGALAGACKTCGAVNQPADKFCGGCAKSLTVVKSRPPPVVPKAVTHTIPIAIYDEAILSAIERS